MRIRMSRGRLDFVALYDVRHDFLICFPAKCDAKAAVPVPDSHGPVAVEQGLDEAWTKRAPAFAEAPLSPIDTIDRQLKMRQRC